MNDISISDFKEIKDKGLVLIDIYSKACGVCAVVSRKLEVLEKEYPAWTFFSVDSEENPEISGLLTVFTVPTILLLHNGKELSRWARNFSVSEIARYMDRIQDSMK